MAQDQTKIVIDVRDMRTVQWHDPDIVYDFPFIIIDAPSGFLLSEFNTTKYLVLRASYLRDWDLWLTSTNDFSSSDIYNYSLAARLAKQFIAEQVKKVISDAKFVERSLAGILSIKDQKVFKEWVTYGREVMGVDESRGSYIVWPNFPSVIPEHYTF